ncbi:YkvA family protein [Anaeroselena agilis]|uniref:YkvA family protein n=1 Tax=Anaeroselena agilis TaxID=3063788 RepID=A0ABU3NVJ3_9FIRM|nr:YkvA family protein [Selenomonadales bacterium 4137-cl]
MTNTPGKLSLRQKARLLKDDILALFFALKHPATPWYAKALVALIVGYTLSPVDFIPDFIPVLGYLDDLILLPLGIALAVRLIPPAVLAECRRRAAAYGSILPKLWLGAAVILLLWLAIAYAAFRLLS